MNRAHRNWMFEEVGQTHPGQGADTFLDKPIRERIDP